MSNPWHHCRHEAYLEKVRAEGRLAAESARGEEVEPLKEEVERMRQQLEEAQAMYEVHLCLLTGCNKPCATWHKVAVAIGLVQNLSMSKHMSL